MASQRETSAFGPVQWIPDAEVNECPVCGRKFGTFGPHTWRKHHCRACGKVVCSTCSTNQISKHRVCDPCFDLRRADNAGVLTENHINNRQVEKSLRENLKEKHRQLQWFKQFLVRISPPVGDDGRGSAFESTASLGESDGFLEDRLGAASSSSDSRARVRPEHALDAEMQALIGRARRNWTQLRLQSDRSRARTVGLQGELDKLNRYCERCKKDASDLRKEIAEMQSELANRSELEVKVDQLTTKTDELQLELDGLVRRREVLEGFQSPSFFGSSFAGSVAGSDAALVRQGCTERCSDCRGRNCAVM
mmetsp:Transcript_31730/g.69318  ORF Transcript_31730/g.69318 Transcript_31730/m.69318 type:complete len:308 (+) Transcript_31730:38-961(+)